MLSRFGFPAYVPASRFPNSLFDNLLLGEDQIVTNLPYMVKSNHNLLSGEDQIVTNLPYTVKSNHRVKNHFHSFSLLRIYIKTLTKYSHVSTKYLLYKIRLSQRVIVHNMLTLIVYQGFDQYGSKSV